MKTEIQQYRDNYFTDELTGATIHVHDMYNNTGQFETLFNPRKTALISALYEKIGNLPMTIISIGINKPKFIAQGYVDKTSVLDMAYTMVIERFDNFLEENNSKGIVRIDRTTNNEEYKLNARDQHVLSLVNSIRKHGTGFQKIKNIVEEPIVVNSFRRKGLQVADAVAYCTSRRLFNRGDFDPYWDLLIPKFRTNPVGGIEGYGFRIFPR